MLWIKALHIVFIASWFAGLFYLPRIFVNLAMVPPGSVAERERLLLMARKLYRFMMPLAVLALALGLWLWLGYGIGSGPGNGWMHAKLAIVVLLIGYHLGCGRDLSKFARNEPTPRLPPSVVVHRERYDEAGLPAALDAYDALRPKQKPRYPEVHGPAPEGCTWSENSARQLSVPERFGFRAWLRLRGFALD